MESETQVFEHNNFNTSRIDSYTVPSAPRLSEVLEGKPVDVKTKPNTIKIYKKSVSSLNPKISSVKRRKVNQRKV